MLGFERVAVPHMFDLVTLGTSRRIQFGTSTGEIADSGHDYHVFGKDARGSASCCERSGVQSANLFRALAKSLPWVKLQS